MRPAAGIAPRHGVIVLLACVFLYLPFVFENGYRLVSAAQTDFPSFYLGAERAWQEHRSPYGPDALQAAGSHLKQRIFPYLYPPPSLLLFAPLAALPYESAKVALLALNHAVTLILAYLLLFKIGRLHPGRMPDAVLFLFFVVYLIGFRPLTANFDEGQINILVVTLIVVAWHALRAGARDWTVGVALTLAILLKTYPALFLLLLAIRGRYRALLWTLGLIAVASVVAAALLPPIVWSDWFFHALPTGGYGRTAWGLFSPANVHNQSINGYVARLFLPNEFTATPFPHPSLVAPLGYALAGLVLGITVWLGVRTRRSPTRDEALDLEFSVMLLAMFLVAPLSWTHHVVYALPAAFVILRRLAAASEPPYALAAAAAAAFVLAWDVPYGYTSLRAHPALEILMISPKFYAVLTLWFIGGRLLHRTARAPTWVAQPTAVARGAVTERARGRVGG
jgi:alpha-1,2-mannosyltransferase